MYKNQFDKEFINNISYNGYMFYGQCDYLIDKYSNDVAQKLSNSEDVYKIYFEQYDFKECVNFLSQSSLFSSKNILYIKTNKKIPKKEVDQLISICSTNVESTIIFCCIGDVDFKTMAKSFTKKNLSVEVRFFIPTDQEAMNILNQKIIKENVSCGLGELHYLYNMHQKDLSLCINDINKLSILNIQITSNIINTQCFGMGAVSMDDFLAKLFLGNTINKDLYMLLEEGMSEMRLISQTITFAKELFTINSYLKLYGQLNIIEIWGYKLPQDIANKRANIATRFHQSDFVRIFNFFSKLELDLKTIKYLDTNSYTQAQFRKFSASLS